MRIPSLFLASVVLVAAAPAAAQQMESALPAPALAGAPDGAPVRHQRDAALEYALRTRLGGLPNVDLSGVQVHVIGTAVTVSGTVPSNAVRDRVLMAANTVDGVSVVRDELAVAASPARGGGPGSDPSAQVREAVARDPGVVGGPLQVSARGGIVTLAGHVATYDDARRVLRTVQHVPGVTAVRSNLTVNESIVVNVRTAQR